MNCLMAVLTEETKTSEVSKLPSAAFIPFSHPSGFILMKSKIAPQKNKKNNCYPNLEIRLSQTIRGKFCLTKLYYKWSLMAHYTVINVKEICSNKDFSVFFF
jgi:hypothetical protein